MSEVEYSKTGGSREEEPSALHHNGVSRLLFGR